MLASDIVAMPSNDSEGFGLIAQEAMLLKRLLLVTECGGLKEFTGPDCAVIVKQNSVFSLLQGLQEALEKLKQPSLLGKMLEQAHRRVMTMFAPVNVVNQLETAYDLACRRRAE